MSLSTGCSTKPIPTPNDPIIINKSTYIFPPDFLLRECNGEPVDNKIQTVITEQKRIIDNCNAQLKLLRDWVDERRLKQQE
jgi:hypothetical protein